MKYILVLLFASAFQCFFGQSENFEKINEVFGENYAENLEIANPGQLKILEKYAETGFIVLNGKINSKNVVEIKEIPLRNKTETLEINEFIYILQNETYNPLTFAWVPGIQPVIYKLADSEYFICIPSQKQLDRI
jgi:hypothetical protein